MVVAASNHALRAYESSFEALLLLTDVQHEVFELVSGDGAAAVLVEGPEGEPHHVLVVVLGHLGGHHVAELGELDLPGPVRVVLVNQI